MSDVAKKIESIGSAIIVGEAIRKQLGHDKEAYIEAFAEQQKGIPDERVKALHKVVYNINLNAYAQSEKELTKEIESLKESLEDEKESAIAKKQASPDSQDQ